MTTTSESRYSRYFETRVCNAMKENNFMTWNENCCVVKQSRHTLPRWFLLLSSTRGRYSIEPRLKTMYWKSRNTLSFRFLLLWNFSCLSSIPSTGNSKRAPYQNCHCHSFRTEWSFGEKRRWKRREGSRMRETKKEAKGGTGRNFANI